MKITTKEWNERYCKIIQTYEERTRKEYEEIKASFAVKAAKYGQKPVRFLAMPKLLTDEIEFDLKRIAETTYQILVKVMRYYLEDEAYRKLFGFDPFLESLILSPCCYRQLLPVLRVDLFYNEETKNFVFCEFNTDGASGMAEETDIIDGLQQTYAFYKFSKDIEVTAYRLIDRLVEELLAVYQCSHDAMPNLTLAIVDFLESSVLTEFHDIRSAFEAKGITAVIADIRELSYRDGALYHQGRKIDAIYRRAVTGEIMRKKDECADFLSAVKDGKVCMIGHLRTQIAHVKQLFSILGDDRTKAILTQEENDFVQAHIPFTTSLKSGSYDYNEVLLNREEWIIKPQDLYASEDVFAGIELSDQQWAEALEKGIKNDYLIQRFYHPYQSRNCYFDEKGSLQTDEFLNITGLYLFNGKFSGIFSRGGRYAVISDRYDGCTFGTMIVKQS